MLLAVKVTPEFTTVDPVPSSQPASPGPAVEGWLLRLTIFTRSLLGESVETVPASSSVPVPPTLTVTPVPIVPNPFVGLNRSVPPEMVSVLSLTTDGTAASSSTPPERVPAVSEIVPGYVRLANEVPATEIVPALFPALLSDKVPPRKFTVPVPSEPFCTTTLPVYVFTAESVSVPVLVVVPP